MYSMWLLSAIAVILNINLNYATPLDDYVNTPDPIFSWKLLQTYTYPTYSMFVLNMTSQQWLDGFLPYRSIKIFLLIEFS